MKPYTYFFWTNKRLIIIKFHSEDLISAEAEGHRRAEEKGRSSGDLRWQLCEGHISVEKAYKGAR